MKITLDLKELKDLELTPNQYVALYILNQNQNYTLTSASINDLTNKGYLLNNKLTDKARNIFKTVISFDVKTLTKNYLELFPKKVVVGGYPVRSSFNEELVKKMNKFVKSYGYTEEEIITATKHYVEEKKKTNYEFMKLAKYFIEKQGQGSMLADYCQYIRDNPEVKNQHLMTLSDYNIKLK
jgi:hypothetical protein